MIIKNILFRYYEVQIKNDKPFAFPKLCVVCGKGNPGGEPEFKGNYGGSFGAWKQLFLSPSALKIPAHMECKENLRRKEKIHMMLIMIAWIILVVFLKYTNRSIFSIEYLAGFVFICLAYNVVINRVFSPIPFFVLEYKNKTSFFFTNKKYYEMFLSSNEESVIAGTKELIKFGSPPEW